jgi:hypothetical protein
MDDRCGMLLQNTRDNRWKGIGGQDCVDTQASMHLIIEYPNPSQLLVPQVYPANSVILGQGAHRELSEYTIQSVGFLAAFSRANGGSHGMLEG